LTIRDVLSTLRLQLSQYSDYTTGWTTGIQFLLGAVMGLFWG